MTIGLLSEAPNILGFWVWNLLLLLPTWCLEFWGSFQLCRKFAQSCRQALHDSVNVTPSGFEASLSSVHTCTSLLSFILSVYMNIVSDNRAITLATSSCFGLVHIVQTGMEKKRKVAKSKVSTRKVQRPATSTQVFLCFPVSISKCWDGSQHSKLPLHASHVALPT